MKMTQCVSCQDFLSRALHVLSTFLIFQTTTFGFKSKLWERKLSFPQERSLHKQAAIPVLTRAFKRTLDDGTPMSDTQNIYSKFYDQWLTFAENIPNKLNSKTPCPLWAEIGVIGQIITPTDHAFYTMDIYNVIERIVLTLNLSKAYLKTLEKCRYIRRNPESQRFFSSFKSRLDLMMMFVDMSLVNLNLHSLERDVEIVDAGIGGINHGVKLGMRRGILKRLKNLVTGLLSSKC